MIGLPSFLRSILVLATIWENGNGQMLGQWGKRHRVVARQNGNGNNGEPDTNAFNIVNGRIFTPGLGIILAPQPFTPMGGDFLQVAIDVSGDGKLQVPPKDISDPLTQAFNFTMFLTSNTLSKNFTISNITTTTPPLADIMNQEPGQTVKHINFEWPDCLVGDGKEDLGTTARGEYNISIHQNFRLNGSDFYSIFNLPISVTNSISQFPGARQLLTNPAPGPLSANGGRMSCGMISNPVMDFTTLVRSVNNPPGQPYQDIPVETAPRDDGGQIGGPGVANGNGGTPAGGTSEGQVGNGATALSAGHGDTLFAGLAMFLILNLSL
ncbi:hypothetical protein PMIN06_005428 [Paraphaeosphaeria minitans]|uniref:Uncharacterized protein n=1 Tax=Paraphaeosphaeria minitans TaxID=565426 RepID=A0A9P6GCI2_9PLEO|nr:hypothetical protein PMIN01_08729 [Paraphaeosphaeria minitans]